MKIENKIIQTKQVILEGEEILIFKDLLKYVFHRMSYHQEDSNWVKSLSAESKQIILSMYEQIK